MKIKKNNSRGKAKGAPVVHSPHAIFAPALLKAKHGLYRSLTKIDGRTRIALIKKSLKKALLERFPDPAPVMAQVIADRCAIKLIRAASYETYVLQGGNPSPSADKYYLNLTGSIRSDMHTLWIMSKEVGNDMGPLSLSEYLREKMKKANLQILALGAANSTQGGGSDTVPEIEIEGE